MLHFYPNWGLRPHGALLNSPEPSIRVLVVDDSALDAAIVADMLRALGCVADTAGSARDAITMVEQGVSVVLMDLTMPDIDGFAASRQIRALPAPAGLTPIVALTARTLPEDRVRCLEAGMDLWLSKPVVREGLARALSRFTGWKESAPQVASVAVLDETRVADLRARAADIDSGFFNDVVHQFRQSAEAAVDAAARHLRAGALAESRAAVALVLEAAGNVGAKSVAEVAERFEAADDGTLTVRGSDWLEGLASEVLRASVALEGQATPRSRDEPCR